MRTTFAIRTFGALATLSANLIAGTLTSSSDPVLTGATVIQFNDVSTVPSQFLKIGNVEISGPLMGTSSQVLALGDPIVFMRIQFSFANPVSAFGMDFWADRLLTARYTLTATDSSGNESSVSFAPDPLVDLSGFYGLTGNRISRATLEMQLTGPEIHFAAQPLKVSNLRFVTQAQAPEGSLFDSGSNGSYGALNITETTTLDLPPDGIFHCTTLTIAANTVLKFKRNALNTPVYLLAQGRVVIDGIIDVGGGTPPGGFERGTGGPGGFDGGPGGYSGGGVSLPGGVGFGPGAGVRALSASYAGGAFIIGSGTYEDDKVYGNPHLIPLIGGSGGRGLPGRGGGGGGGAILVASNDRIIMGQTGLISARGGGPEGINDPRELNGGSGGAIRLVAPRVYGTGSLDVTGGGSAFRERHASPGRIRIDSIFKFEPEDPANQRLALSYEGNSPSIGATMIIFPPNNPHLDIIEVAEQAIAEGSSEPVKVRLPLGANPTRIIKVQARNFNAKVPIRVMLTPQTGDPVSYDAEIDNSAGNPAVASVSVTFPLNELVHVHAWTR